MINMQYLDFSSLLILAIGCNLIYIVNKDSKKNKLSFFLFLGLINNTKETIKKFRKSNEYATVILSKLEEIKRKSVIEIEQTYGKEDSAYILKHINIGPKKLGKYEKVLFLFSGTSQLQFITLITFIYSFFVALLVPYKLDFFGFNELLLQINIAILLFSVILFIYGIVAKNKSKIQEMVLLSIAILCSLIIWFKGDYLIELIIKNCNNILYYNYAITVLVCFTGFILYTILHIIGYIISLYFTNVINVISPVFFRLEKIFEKDKKQSEKVLLKDVKNITM
jgi:hypothetical protein